MASSSSVSSSFVVPGMCISSAIDHITTGKGTYILGDYIYSSLSGFVRQRKEGEKTVIEVLRGDESVVVPTEGVIVTAKVLAVKRRFCKCAIYCIENKVLKEPFRAMILKEDVREKAKDSVEMHKCFRTGDIVLARVKCIGTGQFYLLSTAEDELGVALALSETGSIMIATSWTEMMCPTTFDKVPRKVAKIVPKNVKSESAEQS